MDKKWYVFYTKSRGEKKAKENLERFGFEVFLPTVKVLRQWSDRKKKVEVPLFNSYLFVYEASHRLQAVLNIPGVAWSVRHNGAPAFLRAADKALIERLVASGYTLESTDEVFHEADHVKVLEGVLKGLEGQVIKCDDHKVMLALPSIGQAIKVEIPPHLLQKIV